ncbi:MAG: hypothetical protein ABIM46_08035 [candidate division WOR-3 bacterium]
MGLKIYTGDGRLVYSGELRKGKNIIILNRGVYIWRAERFKGRIVVR